MKVKAARIFLNKVREIKWRKFKTERKWVSQQFLYKKGKQITAWILSNTTYPVLARVLWCKKDKQMVTNEIRE